jgi:alpha-mannosidase
MPYDTFNWRGIDGTGINTFFLTGQKMGRGEPSRGTTYVGHITAEMVAGTYQRFKNKNLHNEALLTFGFGDGGGGPTEEDLETYRRSKHGIPGSSNARIDFAGDFLARLEKKIEKAPALPEWRGELYLEFHRGTYTSISKNKRNNRKSELLYQDAEFVSVLNKELAGAEFPKMTLRNGWEMILTNQFHDIIPGSSIKEVYDQSDIDYARVLKDGESVRSGAAEGIASRLDRSKGYVVFNPHSFTSDGIVKLDGVSAIVKDVPSKGYALTNTFIRNNSVKIRGRRVETNRYRITFNSAWLIKSIYDKQNEREIVKPGSLANAIEIYPDYPDVYDAWEWQEYSREACKVLTDVTGVDVVDDGVRKGIHIVRSFQSSKIEQTVWFTDDGARIDFETVADWHERHLMVKAAFPVDINSDKATYDIQFGTTERPTHQNTSWDRAKFEVCAHKFADLSDGGYGVALMNDCKYGYDIHGDTMRLSLFKCATDPNPEADQGIIEFTYSLCPHAGTFAQSDVQREAYYLNYPMYAVKASGNESSIPERFSAVSVDCDNVICETVKEAEDSCETVIRLYESKNRKQKVNVTVGLAAERCFVCDMLERELYELPIVNGAVSTVMSGFEILTLKLE